MSFVSYGIHTGKTVTTRGESERAAAPMSGESRDEADRRVRQRRLTVLQEAARLHPLSLACVEVGDWLLRDLVQEITEVCQREVAGEVTCTKEVQKLLEGTIGTLANGGEKISAPLHAFLSEEVAETAKHARISREALASTITGSGVDIFGNRPKASAAAETIVCCNCKESLAANRFAPHLERCMLGKGRASARQAREAMQGMQNT